VCFVFGDKYFPALQALGLAFIFPLFLCFSCNSFFLRCLMDKDSECNALRQVLKRTSTIPGRVGRIMSKESLEAAASAVYVSYPTSTNFLMSSPLNFAPRHLSFKTWRSALHSISLSIRQRRKKELQEKQRKSGKMKASPSAYNARKYLSPKTKHTRSNKKERNGMLALPNSHRKLCTRGAKDYGTIGKVVSPVSGRPKTRGSRGEERQLSLPLLA